jgi:alpha-amylase/alpha-mannosidase (GH57 family)
MRFLSLALAVLVTALVPTWADARPVAAPDGIVFTLDAPGASQVYIAGEFNGWAPTRDVMAKAEGSVWRIALALKPGRYQYKFVVDGKDWRQDPDNPLSVPDPYGGRNSVVVVRDDGTLDFSGGSAEAVQPVVGSLPLFVKPLHLTILWHQHQPRYFKDPETGEYLEPWVRIHGIKDYYDMVAILREYPGITVTVNLTPVLLEQLEEIIRAYDDYAARPHHPGRPDFIPGCDMWVRLTLTPAESLTYNEKALLLRNFFRMPRETMIDPYPRFAELADKKRGDSDEDIQRTIDAYTDADWRDLQAWFNLAEFDPDFREGQVVLPDGQTASVAGLVAKGRNFTEADKAEIIATQFRILRNIIPLHQQLQAEGRIEVITSPFYHPILPLVCDTDVARQADPGIDLPTVRFAYPVDAEAQVQLACGAYLQHFGRKARGMWPSEGSVSEAVIPIAARAGLDWIASDEEVLAKSLGKGSMGPYDKYRMYYAGASGARVGIIFRDHKLSDEIGFNYSKMNGVAAANDLLKKLHTVYRGIQDLDGEFVVPIIMDGENAWENFERDGKDFFRSLYSQLSQAPWLRTMTISDYFDEYPPPASLDRLAPGSWISPDFNTWIGEPEENKAWEYLALARAAVGERLPGLSLDQRRAVMHEIYIAEGSDWFWWYGLDQNSGNDESFDNAFRGTLINAYRAAGLEPPQYLVLPIVSVAANKPETSITGMVSPELDGVNSGPAEWEKAAYTPDAGGTPEWVGGDMITGLYYGYDQENLWLRLETGLALDVLAARSCHATVFFSGASDVNAQVYADAPEGAMGHYFGFGLSSKVDITFEGGVQAVFLVPDGLGGWTRERSLPLRSSEFIELAVPFGLIGLDTGQELRFGVVGYCGDQEAELVPDTGFLGFTIPPLGRMAYIRSVEDPVGDDRGPGDYTYPSDKVFVPGAFDIASLDVTQDSESNLIFKLVLAGEVTCPWGGLTGYSLQAVDIYIDTDGVPDSGQRSLYKARKARTTPDNAWEFFVRASMDSVAMYDAGMKRLDGVKVTSYADAATSSIFIKFPRSEVFGPAEGGIETWSVIVALLGHDGYSDGGIRPVKAAREQWVFGGCDREDLCPSIIDLVVDVGVSQQDVLSAYRLTGRLVEVPGVKLELP